MVKVGSIWTGSDFTKFEVRSVEEREDGIWVSYGKHAQDRTYECLIDAFLERFRIQVS